MSKVIDVKDQGQQCYQIVVEHDFSNFITCLMQTKVTTSTKLCIITDSNVAPLYLKELKDLLEAEFQHVLSIEFKAGEEQKTLSTVQNLYQYLILNQFDRSDLLIAFGGGVVGDITGYTAATYLRGISFVQLPTTLLSQVDSSIGGKTGVDFLSFKNMVGAFHQPSLVYINLALLKTLPKEQFLSGMGEIVKHGLIKDVNYYQWLCEYREKIQDQDIDILEEMITISCQIKRNVVEQDPKEQGERAVLNFGHTIGHAIEKLYEFQMPHGQCVALGMLAASYISFKYGSLSKNEFERIERDLNDYQFPTTINAMDKENILKVTKSDKKMVQGKIKFILLKEIGQACIEMELTDDQILEGIQYLLK